MLPIEKELEEYKRKLLDERLSKVTDTQRGLFNKIYPRGVPENKLIDAIDLCDRTIRKNEAGRI